jgi:bacillithiol biosynthesis cysteine-adding enzyme BshC
MDFRATHFPYRLTGYFSKIILDYLDEASSLQSFYSHPVSLEGIKSAIVLRQQFGNDRKTLVEALKMQYRDVDSNHSVNSNIDLLLQPSCFTITTAHQPAIFTGSLYFIYKILHVIKLAAELNHQLPQYQFVPVFFMGSEDADLDELGKIYLNQEKLVWDTKQTGAVGRMKTDGLDTIIDRIEGEYGGLPNGPKLLTILRDAYTSGQDIQSATFKLIHALFAEFGLVVLIPDHAKLKKIMEPVFADDLFHQRPSTIVEKTIDALAENYKVQANPRQINLFYLKEAIRERIVQTEVNQFKVQGTRIAFSADELKRELEQHPERFSPNVILRGLYQETILPGVAFIGGGGENSYWLELKELFDHYKVPFPVIILRNSFLLVLRKWNEKLKKMNLTVLDICRREEDLVDELVQKESHHQLNLGKEMTDATNLYEKIKELTIDVDASLAQHVDALKSKAIKPLEELEKKILKAEKRKFEDQRRQIHAIKTALFPFNGLQERIDNFLPYYAQYGKSFIDMLYKQSLGLEQEFTSLEESL